MLKKVFLILFLKSKIRLVNSNSMNGFLNGFIRRDAMKSFYKFQCLIQKISMKLI